MDELLNEIAMLSFIEIQNKHQWFYTRPDSLLWIVTVEHCTKRGTKFRHEGYDLKQLLELTLRDLKQIPFTPIEVENG